ncbi:MAG TPA: FHA domain-containing protein [Wenzhouxiangella sp.]
MKFRLKAASGPLTGQTFDLNVDVTRIGSDQGMDVVLDGLSGEHALISTQGEGLVIEPMGQSAVFLNGEVIDSTHGLTSGDEIRLGGVRLVLQAPGLKPQRVLETTQVKKPLPWVRIGFGVVVVVGAALAYVYWQHPEIIEMLAAQLKVNNAPP